MSGLGIDALERPVLGALALVLAAVALVLAARRRPAALPWPALAEARAAGARARDPLRALGLALRGLALAALALALAGPVGLEPGAPGRAEGLDLVLALDVSGSMRALDAQRGGERGTRLDLAREVVARFARRRAAEGDRVGLVVFGESAFTQTPLTRDGGLLEAALGRLESGVAGEGTALGDGLALAVKRVVAGGAGAAQRVVVLLSDGRSNAGAVPVDVAAALAARLGVRVHAVGIGSVGEVPVAASGEPGRRLRFERHDLDARTLESVAAASGGRFFPARSGADLSAVYDAIDRLERSPRALPPRALRVDRAELPLAAAGALLLAEIGLLRVARRRLP